jgi:hypothetical protein
MHEKSKPRVKDLYSFVNVGGSVQITAQRLGTP